MAEADITVGIEPRPASGSGVGGYIATFLAGEVVAGRFRIVRILGQGGMGQVYEAFDMHLRETVALKVIRPEIAAQADALERFRREVSLARKVTHPQVCRIHDFVEHRLSDAWGETAGSIGILNMEYLPGRSLASVIANGPVAVERALRWGRQIAAGLEATHAAGILHRDVKAANVTIVEGDRGAVLGDFGIATADLASDDDGGGVRPWIGTPDYLAPEIQGGGPATVASDIYALGVVLYELLAGVRPRRGVQRWIEIDRERLPHARMRRLVERCLDEDPARRIASASAVRKSLEERDRLRWSARGVAWLVPVGLALVAVVALSQIVSSRRSDDHVDVSVRSLDDRTSKIMLLSRNDAGRAFIAGDWQVALERFETELSLLGQEVAPAIELELIADLVTVHARLGNTERAWALVGRGLQICKRAGKVNEARGLQLMAVRILVDEGALEAARTRLRWLDVTADPEDAMARVRRIALGARILLDRGEYSASRAMLARIREGDLDRRYRFRMEIEALAAAAGGELAPTDSAIDEIVDAIEIHRVRRRVVYAFDFEYALAEVLLRRGDVASGRSHLEALSLEASALGFAAVAARAEHRLERVSRLRAQPVQPQ